MAYNAVPTYANTQLIDEDDFNLYLRDNMEFFYKGISARVYHNTTQSMTLATVNYVLFNTDRFDNTAMHDPVSNTSRLTAIVAGVYEFYFNGEWATAPASGEAYFHLNRTDIYGYQTQAGAKRFIISSGPVLMTAGQYMEVVLNPVSTQTLNSTAKYSPEFCAVWRGSGL